MIAESIEEMQSYDKAYAIAKLNAGNIVVHSSNVRLLKSFNLKREGDLEEILNMLQLEDANAIFEQMTEENLILLKWLDNMGRLDYKKVVAVIDERGWSKSFDYLVTNSHHSFDDHAKTSRFYVSTERVDEESSVLTPADETCSSMLTTNSQTVCGEMTFHQDSIQRTMQDPCLQESVPGRNDPRLAQIKNSLVLAVHEAYLKESFECFRELLKNPHVDIDAVCEKLRGMIASPEIFKLLISDERIDLTKYHRYLITAVGLKLEDCVNIILHANMLKMTPDVEASITASITKAVGKSNLEILKSLLGMGVGHVDDAIDILKTRIEQNVSRERSFLYLVELINHKSFDIFNHHDLFIVASTHKQHKLITLLNQRLAEK